MKLKAIRVGVGAAASVVAVALAPSASATVTGVTIESGTTLGTHSQGTGCSYTVTATVDDDTKTVFFFEEGQGPTGFASAKPVDGVAEVTWTPSKAGISYIYAVQPDAWPETRLPVDVGTGVNLGSACLAV